MTKIIKKTLDKLLQEYKENRKSDVNIQAEARKIIEDTVAAL